MLPIVVLAGRPNVGKSMLFNKLTRTQDALVSSYSGLTRDLRYGEVKWNKYRSTVIDTGGITSSKEEIDCLVNKKSLSVMKGANLILLIVDAQIGPLIDDHNISNYLLRLKKNCILVVNKMDKVNIKYVIGDFYSLGIRNIIPVSALYGYKINYLLKEIVYILSSHIFMVNDDFYLQNDNCNSGIHELCAFSSCTSTIRLAVIGRPNVGKSTIINCLLGKEQLLVHNTPGTTRDSIPISIVYNNQQYIFFDTAGVRRQAKILEITEKNYISQSLLVLAKADIVLLIINANDGITDQDLTLLKFAMDKGRSVIIIVNKWDTVLQYLSTQVKININSKIRFVDFIPVHFVSALYDFNVHDIFCSIKKTYKSAFKSVSTGKLNKILQIAIHHHQPALVSGYRPQLKYVHIGRYNPMTIVIHGSCVKRITNDYKRYLINYFTHALHLMGNSVRLQFNESINPFLNKKNI